MAKPPSAARLAARPGIPSAKPLGPGIHPLDLERERDGMLQVPPGYRPDTPSPLILTLHGSGGSAAESLSRLGTLAGERGALLLAAESRVHTWDVVRGGYGPDVQFIDRALAAVFLRCAVDPGRVAVEGFSDGASYALGLGLSNGALFTHVLAFSPGFLPGVDREGAPSVFVSHGTADEVLPIDQCSRRIVPELRALGYWVRYLEFDGKHLVPPPVAAEGLGWFLG
jgi:phospholipase/carboxylesterase